MDPLTAMRVQLGCTDLIARYALAVNRWDLDAFIALWTPDAVWQRPGNPPLEGQAAIRAFMADQPTVRVMRHIIGANVVTPVDEHTARSWSQTTMYTAAGTTTIPAPVEHPDMIVEYVDEISISGEQFRFARREATVVFRSAR
jgi:uncharacterized protein (TIGR02246 family)